MTGVTMNFQYNYTYGPPAMIDVDNYTYGGNYPYPPSCPTGPMAQCYEVGSPERGLDEREEPRIPTISVKVNSPGKKSDYKTFLVRGVTVDDLQCLANLKEKFVEELGAELLDKDLKFDMGYYRGNKRLWIRNDRDLSDLLARSAEKDELTIWCEGLCTKPTTGGKRRKKASHDSGSVDRLEISSDSDSSTYEPRRTGRRRKKKKTLLEEKQDRIDEIVDKLREKHNNKYTSLQYRVWAETIVAGQHEDIDKPPRGSFFTKNKCSGGSTPPKQHVSSGPKPLTPGKVTDLRSSYIKQIKEMHNLVELRAIPYEHFEKQRDILLKEMDSLNGCMHYYMYDSAVFCMLHIYPACLKYPQQSSVVIVLNPIATSRRAALVDE